ncbi:3422_t:CDS:2 [Diversispora eburnea]|uniref:3422_t:CDS:1 n=1 Tax=Diversispora eburnea TaxID=1213867 RepID=A0A9N9A516_9GLOM|nr:3422_t:CDS:2 [Diversispora eburnea]
MTSEQKYPGYEELTSYLTRSRDKSFWSFLLYCRDAIVATTSPTSRWYDLDNFWYKCFLVEAKELLNQNDFNNLEKQVSEDRKCYNFEDYWNDVIDACKIKQKILAYEKEKERIQLEHLHKLNEIDKKIEMENIELQRQT